MRTVIYWLFVPAITDSANKCSVFGGHFNPKSLAARTLSCGRQFTQISMLPTGDRKQYFISRVNACVMLVTNHVIVALCLHSFYDITSYILIFCVPANSEPIRSLAKPMMSKKSTILSFDLCAWYRAVQQKALKQTRSPERAIVAEWNSGDRPHVRPHVGPNTWSAKT